MTRTMPKTMLAGALLTLVSAAPARAQSCEEAFYQRNILFKNAGYCFRTPRAIAMFGNAGCRYDRIEDVPLSARDRAAAAEIQAFERTHGCPP